MAFEMPNFGGEDKDAGGDRNGHPAGSSGGVGSASGHRVAFGVPPRRTKVLAITVVIMVVLVALFFLFESFYTSYLWYHSVGMGPAYRTRTVTQAVLFLVFGALMASLVGANVWLAYRLRPPLTGVSLEQQALDRYRMGLAPFLTWTLAGLSVLFGIAAGASSAAAWRTYLLWADAVPFGTKDPQFHKDIGFYIFTLPWLRHIQGFLVAVVLLSLLAALLTHYLYAGVALTPPTGAHVAGRLLGSRATRAAQIHISILLGCLVLVKAYAYWLDRYSLSVAPSKITSGWSGPTYKDVHAVLPAKTILLVIAVLCALLFFANAVRLIVRGTAPVIDRGGHPWALPALGVSLMVLASVVIGGVYPLAVQQLRVNPDQGAKEAPYIQRNIDATRAAYGLDDVQAVPYAAKSDVAPNQLAADAQTVGQIRVMDPAVLSAAYDQQQAPVDRPFHTFPDTLAIDRYPVDGKSQDTVVGVSGVSLAGLPAGQRDWYNEHLKYTYGYGLMAAKADAAQPDGSPDYIDQNLPATGALGSYEQRVYFGSGLPDYSIIGGSAAGAPGVKFGSFLGKLMYAAKFHQPKILVSGSVAKNSRILYDRDPRQRVEAAAPWLTVDGATYPVVVNGRILWVVDGYTTTASYPYSTSTDIGGGKVNYVRNAVKATVDAYDGTVTLYAWDDSDPILKTWMKAFPGTVKPRSDISPDLLAHMRYPQDLFNAQRDIYGRYHVTSPSEFYDGTSFWSVPNDPTKDASAQQPSNYMTLQMPGQSAPTFSLTSALTATSGGGLAAFMAVDSDPGPDYGKIRVLQIPSSAGAQSPAQVQNAFRTAFAGQMATLQAGNTKVITGDMLTLPVGGGVLSVEPIYTQATTGPASYPLLAAVQVAFGGKTASAPTLQQALDSLFSGTSGAKTGENPPTPGQELKQAIDEAATAQKQAIADLAQTPPNWTAFGADEQRAQDALKRAQDIENGPRAPK